MSETATSGELAVRDERPAALVPRDIDQALRLADVMAKNSLVPNHLRSKPADCFMVIEVAARWGMSPFAVAQCTSVIQGKLMYEGKLVAAVVNARGELAKRLDYRFEGEGDKLRCFPFGTLRGEDKPREIPEGVELAKVRTNNEMWRKQPHQQLTYAAARIWARRHMPEVMLGVYAEEEMDVTPVATTVTVLPKASAPQSATSAAHGGSAPVSYTAPAATTAETRPPTTGADPIPAEPAESSTDDHEPKPGEFRDLVECFVWKWYAGRAPTKVERAAAANDTSTLGEWVSTGAADMEPQRSLDQNSMLQALRQQRGIEDADWRERLQRLYNKRSSKDLSVREASDLIDRLQKAVAQHGTADQKKERQQRRAAEAGQDIAEYLRTPGEEG